MENKKVFNFSAGPAMMPVEVMQQVQAEFLNWHSMGVSIAEISHRSQTYIDLTKQIEKDFSKATYYEKNKIIKEF